MSQSARPPVETHDRVLRLLSEPEVARVGTATTAEHLLEGDEYIDLAHLAAGVRFAVKATPRNGVSGGAAPVGRVLLRRAVSPATWARVVTALASLHPHPTE